jgi:hypothetical protein
MIDADKPRLAEWLTGCAEVYDKTVSQAGIAIWWGILSHFPTEAVDRAFKAHVADPDTGRRMPTPADIVGRITGGSEAAALDAWTKVEGAIRSAGSSRSVVFDDPLIHACLASMGGWVRLCQSDADDMPFRRRDFVAAYKGYRQRNEKPQYPGVLTGRYSGGMLTLIGDHDKARLVFKGGAVPGELSRIALVAMSDAIDDLPRKPQPVLGYIGAPQ